MIDTLMTDYLHTIVFLHVLGAMVWVGGMVIMRFVVHPNLSMIDGDVARLNFALQTMQRLFGFMFLVVVLVVITALILAFGMDLPKESDMAFMMQLKEGILAVMVLNYVLMILRRKEAERIYKNVFYAKARAALGTIANYLLPLNILLGFVALYLGVSLRGL